MLVRMLSGCYAGEIRDMPSHIARQAIADGRVSPAQPGPEPETTAIEPQTERAVRRRGRPRKVKAGGRR